ncbi:hypothetical protein EAY64_09820 [Aquitalea palustris]|uniref:Uncharacterized protein n=1 Tax=Aquitalea palustris TaxID=2480983 RepID=A0A454JIN1_9NEIS|nr:hypothetical protein EAY64_09820 [Aquitalea palustris]
MPDTDTVRAHRKRRTMAAFMVMVSQRHKPGWPLQSEQLIHGIRSLLLQGGPTQAAPIWPAG